MNWYPCVQVQGSIGVVVDILKIFQAFLQNAKEMDYEKIYKIFQMEVDGFISQLSWVLIFCYWLLKGTCE